MKIQHYNGSRTTAEDQTRVLWYGSCGFWTDDWDLIKTTDGTDGGIPCCPTCGCPGFIITAKQWFVGVEKFQADGHPRYREFIDSIKGKCFGRKADIVEQYQKWFAANER